MVTEMVLRGFSGRLSDLRGRMRFCHPILSPKGNEAALFVATSIDWRPDGTGLKSVNRDEISSFGTLWPASMSTVSPGVGVALIGSEFMREVSAAMGSAEAEKLPFKLDNELECWISIGQRSEFDQCAKNLAAASRVVFDRELRRSALASSLSKAGAAALFVLRRAPGRRESDVAMRELAAAIVQGEHDLYRRLLAVLSVKLDLPENTLDRQAKRHVESIRTGDFVGRLDPQNAWVFRQVKSIQFLSEPSVLVYNVRRSGDPSNTFYTYVSKSPASEKIAAYSEEGVAHTMIIQDRPPQLDHIQRTRIGRTSSGIWEHVYERG